MGSKRLHVAEEICCPMESKEVHLKSFALTARTI
jgi:hypothetical protein